MPKFGQKWPIFEYLRSFQAYRKLYEQHAYKILGRFMAEFGSYRSKTLKTVNFGRKKAKF